MEISTITESSCEELRREIIELEGVLELYGHSSSDNDEQRAITRILNIISQRKVLLSRCEVN